MKNITYCIVTLESGRRMKIKVACMHEKYLPFTKQQLLSHFADVKRKGRCAKNEKHLEYYEKSIDRYTRYLSDNPDRIGKPLKGMRFPCQLEKDERFWVAACLMTVFYSQNRTQEFVRLFKGAYGDKPLIEGIDSWKECVAGKLQLFFEAKLPSPKVYKRGVWSYGC